QPRRDPEVVLGEERAVIHDVVLVLAGALIELTDLAEQEVRERISRAGGRAAGELEMAGAAELVPDLDVVALPLTAELQVVLAGDPRRAIVELDAGTVERRFEVVSDVEEVVGVDLGDRRERRIDRQPDAEFLHRRPAGRWEAARERVV